MPVLLRERKTHDARQRHPLYAVWRSMKARCFLPSHQAWHLYGGRGITVCERWLKFENFWADMGPIYRPGLTLERINNAGNYTPNNCAWVTRRTQARNRRTNHIIATSWGEMTIVEAAERSGINAATSWGRLARSRRRGALEQI